MVIVPRSLRRFADHLPARRRVALVCGLGASVLSVIADVIGTLKAPNYSFVSQSISDLTASGVPTRHLVMPLSVTSDMLILVFSIGAWSVAGRSRALRVTAVLLAENGVASLVATTFFPKHLDEAASAAPNLINTVVMASGVVCFLLAMGFGAAARRGWFRYYSIGTLAAFVVLSITRPVLPIPASAVNSSLTGVQERTMMYGFVLWLTALSLLLLLEHHSGKPRRPINRTGVRNRSLTNRARLRV